MTEKMCPKCKITQTLDKFSIARSRKDGRHWRCKLCENKYYRDHRDQILTKRSKYYEKNKVRIDDYTKTYKRKWRHSPRGNALTIIEGAKRRAQRDNIPFSLNNPDFVSNLTNKLERGTCELSGLPFVSGKNGQSPYSPSLDRITPSLGYIPKNVRVICLALNVAFRDWGEDVFLEIATAWMKRGGASV